MIEINLLKKKKPFKLPIILGMDFNQISIKGWIFAVILSYGADLYFKPFADEMISSSNVKIANMKKEQVELQKKLSGEGGIRKKLDAFNKQVEVLTARQKQVDSIIKERTNPRDLLEQLSKKLPEDLWFEELVIDRNHEIQINGTSQSYKSIGQFLNQSNELPFFDKSLVLVSSKTEDQEGFEEGRRAEVFQIKGKVKTFDIWRDR